jgi:hypothetical protein
MSGLISDDDDRRLKAVAAVAEPDSIRQVLAELNGPTVYDQVMNDRLEADFALLETEEVLVGNPGSYELAVVVAALAVFILFLAVLL